MYLINVFLLLSCFCFIGEVQVTNAFDASLILFNPELPETLALTNVYDSNYYIYIVLIL